MSAQQMFEDACHRGDLEEAKQLYEANRDNINISRDDDKVFRDAFVQGHTTICGFLFYIRPQIDFFANDYEALKHACENGDDEDIEFLLEYKLNVPDHCYRKAFVFACEAGRIDLAKYIYYKRPGEIKYTDYFNLALRLASGKGHLNIVQWLCQIHHDIQILYFKRAFEVACEFNHRHVAERIFEIKGVELNNFYYWNRNAIDVAFDEACKQENTDMADWLYEKKNPTYEFDKLLYCIKSMTRRMRIVRTISIMIAITTSLMLILSNYW